MNPHMTVKMFSFNHLSLLKCVSGLDSIIAILKETCTSKLKANAVKQEHEKQDELRRSAIRAFVCIFKIPEAGKCCVLISAKLANKPSSFVYSFIFVVLQRKTLTLPT